MTVHIVDPQVSEDKNALKANLKCLPVVIQLKPALPTCAIYKFPCIRLLVF